MGGEGLFALSHTCAQRVPTFLSRDECFGLKRKMVPLFSLYNSPGPFSTFLCGVKGRAEFSSQNIPVNGLQMLASLASACACVCVCWLLALSHTQQTPQLPDI